MAEFTLGGATVLSARISLPRIGVWTAELSLDSDTPPSGAQTLASADGALSLRGTVRASRSAEWQGRSEVLLVGGADGLSTALQPRFYANAPLRVILADLCRETGEVLSATTDQGTLSSTLSQWTRDAGTGGAALAKALDKSGAAWRVLADGTLWCGPETWPLIAPPGDVLALDPQRAELVWGADELPGSLLPGTLFQGRRVSYVEHTIEAQRSRSTVWFEEQGASLDRIKSGFDALARRALRASAFHALYPCTVLSQASDGTVALVPDAPTLPHLTGVRVRVASPGVSLTLAAGARVLLGFENGDPALPFAALFASDAARLTAQRTHAESSLTLDAPAVKIGDNATRGIARLNDTADCGTLYVATSGGVVVGVAWLPPGSPGPAPAGVPIPLSATINSASGRGKCD